ncbi:hypothetical protein RCL1_009040 [Eukaryota sp. TZLM3-RCL]
MDLDMDWSLVSDGFGFGYGLGLNPNPIQIQSISSPTFISDRQKGLIDAVATHFGSITHAYCIRHLSENLLKKCRKKDVVNLLWKVAGATDLEEYTNCIEKIHSLSESAYQYLQQTERRIWTTLHFTGKRYGHLTSNIAESLNSWLKSLRAVPLIPMIEKYRIKLSVQQTWK